jgi:hypothetical protein
LTVCSDIVGANADVVHVSIGSSIFVAHVLGAEVAALVGVDAGVVELEVVGVGVGPELSPGVSRLTVSLEEDGD